MRLILTITLLWCAMAHAQKVARITQPNGEYVELVSDDTVHYKVYPAARYDTIGSWHLVAASDTVRGRFVQVGLCYIYEVRKYYNDWIMVTDGRTEWSSGQKEMFESPHHHAWLDSNKQPLKYVVIKEL